MKILNMSKYLNFFLIIKWTLIKILAFKMLTTNYNFIIKIKITFINFFLLLFIYKRQWKKIIICEVF